MKKEFNGDMPPQDQKDGYPSEFKAKVREVFPDWDDMNRALESGSEFVGKYLDDARGLSMSTEEIVTSFESGDQEKVLEAAQRAEKIRKLYSEWSELNQNLL